MDLLLLPLGDPCTGVGLRGLVVRGGGHVGVGAARRPPHPQLLHGEHPARDGGRLEHHHVLGQRPRLVREQQIDLANRRRSLWSRDQKSANDSSPGPAPR